MPDGKKRMQFITLSRCLSKELNKNNEKRHIYAKKQ